MKVVTLERICFLVGYKLGEKISCKLISRENYFEISLRYRDSWMRIHNKVVRGENAFAVSLQDGVDYAVLKILGPHFREARLQAIAQETRQSGRLMFTMQWKEFDSEFNYVDNLPSMSLQL